MTLLPSLIGTATIQLVRSPVRAADGSLRVLQQEVVAGQTVADALPHEHTWARVIWNGRVLTHAEQQTLVLTPGDELTAFPTWGSHGRLVASALIMIAVGLIVSVATTALSYVLFPAQEAQRDYPRD